MAKDYLGAIRVKPDDLLQYGKLGMKWGVRKRDNHAKNLQSINPNLSSKKAKEIAAKSGPIDRLGAKMVVKDQTKADKQMAKPKRAEAIAEERRSNIQDHVESSSARYDRLAKQAKAGKASDMTEQDLKFFNARTDALAKINKMNEAKPGWLAETSKKVLQQTAQNTMQNIADGVAKKYVSGPILDSIGASGKKTPKKQPLAIEGPKKK